jgi:hypothetical protein
LGDEGGGVDEVLDPWIFQSFDRPGVDELEAEGGLLVAVGAFAGDDELGAGKTAFRGEVAFAREEVVFALGELERVGGDARHISLF